MGSQSQHLLIPYLTPHLANLTSSIRRLALIQYFKPFQAVRLGRMAEAFGLDEEVLLVDVVDLVRSGEIEGRLDLHDRVRFPLPLPPGKIWTVYALFAHVFFAFCLGLFRFCEPTRLFLARSSSEKRSMRASGQRRPLGGPC